MPVALERKLKEQVAGKKMSKDRKDAYVYGTLRKTGWKPEREKKMNDSSETINLAELPAAGSALERISGMWKRNLQHGVPPLGDTQKFWDDRFAVKRLTGGQPYWKAQTKGYERGMSGLVTRDNPNYQGSIDAGSPKLGSAGWLARKRPIGTLQDTSTQSLFMSSSKIVRLSAIDSILNSLIQFKDFKDTAEDVAAGGALTAGGYGAYKLHKAIRGAGGYKQAGSELKEGYTFGNLAGRGIKLGDAARELRSAFKTTPGGAVGGALGILRSKIHLAERGKPVQFETPVPISPWGGSTGHTSKIDQLEFPAGPAPLTIMQMPLPVLMRYLNRPGQLQQAFSWKIERLVQLSSKLDEINA